METAQPVAPTETERSGLTKTSQYATVRTQAKKKPEKPTEMIGSHLQKLKKCCRCKSEKPLEDFYKNRVEKDGYQKECKSCHSASQMKWQSANRDKANEIAKRYWKNRGKEYFKENKEKILDWRKEWFQQNSGKNMQYKRARRAKKLGSTEHFTNKEFKELCKQHDGKCLCCGEKKPLEADHIVPLTKGGSDGIENIQPLCRHCNAKKGMNTIDFR